MLTQYELDNPDHVVIAYRARDLKEFSIWWIDQGRYRKVLDLLRTTSFEFETTSEKMEKGQLIAYRDRIARLGIFQGCEPFHPLATPQGFAKYGKQTVESDGWRYSELMTALQDVPPCLNAKVEVLFDDGREQKITFYHGKEEEKW